MPLGGYTFVNESTIWQPIMVAYSILISGAVLLIFAAYHVLFGRYKKYVPLTLLIGASMFFSVMLGPLGDMLQPSRVWQFLTNPHIFPSSEHPGVSLIAIYGGLLWPIGVILTIIFGLLYFRAYSVGEESEEKFESTMKIAKIFGILLIVFLIPWLFYPGLLFVVQTSTFIWANWHLLPIINLAENFVLAWSIVLFAHYVHKWGNVDEDVVKTFLELVIVSAFSLFILLVLQEALWSYRFGGSPFYETISGVVANMHVIEALLIVFLLVAIVSRKYPQMSVIIGLAGIIIVILEKWNVVIVGQTTSKLGLGLLELSLHGNWFLAFLAPISFAFLIYLILTWFFPVEVVEK